MYVVVPRAANMEIPFLEGIREHKNPPEFLLVHDQTTKTTKVTK